MIRQSIGSFQRNGYAIIPSAVSREQCQAVIASLGVGVRHGAGVRHAMRFPEVRSLASDPALLSIASGLLGSDAQPFKATVFAEDRRQKLAHYLASGYGAAACERVLTAPAGGRGQ